MFVDKLVFFSYYMNCHDFIEMGHHLTSVTGRLAEDNVKFSWFGVKYFHHDGQRGCFWYTVLLIGRVIPGQFNQWVTPDHLRIWWNLVGMMLSDRKAQIPNFSQIDPGVTEIWPLELLTFSTYFAFPWNFKCSYLSNQWAYQAVIGVFGKEMSPRIHFWT